MGVYEKLVDIQSRLKAPKGQFNPFGKYNYRSCEDILEGVKPLLKENGCTLVISDEVVVVGDRIYIKATATLTDVESKETISNSALAREAAEKKGMDDSQITGTASSYARKYALNGMFCIDDTKDADAAYGTAESGKFKSKAKEMIDKAQEAGIAESVKEYKCCDCGKPFTGFKGKDGKDYNAGQAYHISEKINTDGKPRCGDCMNKAGTKKS